MGDQEHRDYTPVPAGAKLQVFNGCLRVDGKPYVVDFPDEPLRGVDETGRLTTWFRGHLTNVWNHEDIKGYYA